MRKLITNIWLILTLDCEQSARLTSESFDRNLDWSERLAGTLHRLICGKSRKLHHQMVSLHEKMETGANVSLPDLSEEARERIQKAIKDNRS